MGTTTRMKRRRRSRQRSVRRGVSASDRAPASPRWSRWRSVTEIGVDGCRFGADGGRIGVDDSRIGVDGRRFGLDDSRNVVIGISLEGNRNEVIKSPAQLSRFDACLAHVAQAITKTARGETRTMIS